MYVKYIAHMGTDKTPVNSARISFGNDDHEDLNAKDVKLLRYLADNAHMSPFEHNVLTVEIYVPMYIAKQIMRHRSLAFNEVSRRYTSENIEFFVPDHLSKQAKSNRQAADGLTTRAVNGKYQSAIWKLIYATEHLYEHMIADGVSREEARGILPQCMYTRFIATGNLRNWVHFIKLRKDKAAQKQIQFVAAELLKILQERFPESTKALIK